MKARSILPRLLGVSGLALLSAVSASAQANRPYVRVDAGAAWTRDTALQEFFGEDVSGARVRFDTGVRFGLTGGYHFTDWFAAELQTGVIANNIDFITGAGHTDAFLSNVPFLANVRFQLPDRCRVCPFFGGGLGGATAILETDRLEFGSTTVDGSLSTAVFAWQAFGGIQFRISDRMSVSAEYRYFATTAPDWRADFTFGTSTDHIRFGGIDTHMASVAFQFQF